MQKKYVAPSAKVEEFDLKDIMMDTTTSAPVSVNPHSVTQLTRSVSVEE